MVSCLGLWVQESGNLRGEKSRSIDACFYFCHNSLCLTTWFSYFLFKFLSLFSLGIFCLSLVTPSSSCSQLPLSLLHLLEFMGFLPFGPKAIATTFGIFPRLPTSLLVALPLPLCRGCQPHHSLFPNKSFCFCFSPAHYLASLQQIRVEGSLYLPLWHASSGLNLCLRFLGETSTQKCIFPKGVSTRTPEQIHSFLTAKLHPLNPLTKDPPPMHWLGTCGQCPGPCASATTIWVCLLSFPHHSCRSCAVFFYHAYQVKFVFYDMRHTWAFGLALPSMEQALPRQGPLFVQPIGCLFLPFLVHSMGLLAILAHQAYYLFPQSPLAHFPHLFPLFFPLACQLSFLPCWPIGLATSFLGLSQPTNFTFTSYSSHGPVGYYSCHVDPLGQLPLFLGFLGSFLHLYLLFFLWDCWLSFLPCWSIGLTNLLLPFLFIFLPISLIVGLLLLFGLSQKMGINIQPLEHMYCSCNSYANTYVVFLSQSF